MTQMIGKNENVNAASAVLGGGISAGTGTSVALVTLTKEDSILILTNDSNQDAWIKMQAASVDNDQKGFILYKGTTTELNLDASTRYVGEISIIAANGNTKVHTTVM